MACGEVIESAVVPMTAKAGFGEPSAGEWRGMFGEMVEECKRGVGVVADTVVVVTRKGG